MTKETHEVIIERFFEWNALSEREREELGLPKTQADFAVKHGISAGILTNWKKHATLDEVRIKELKDRIYSSGMALDAKSKDRELAARVFNLMTPQDININMELSANGHSKVAREVLDELRQQYRENKGVCPVCGKYEVLLPEVCMDTEQEHCSKN